MELSETSIENNGFFNNNSMFFMKIDENASILKVPVNLIQSVKPNNIVMEPDSLSDVEPSRAEPTS